MARGKYAAKAANARAGDAERIADQLSETIAAERATHAARVDELSKQIVELRRQLTTAVREMAASENNRIRADADRQVSDTLGKLDAERESFRKARDLHTRMLNATERLLRSIGFTSHERMEIMVLLTGADHEVEPGHRRTFTGSENNRIDDISIDAVRAIQRARGLRGSDDRMDLIAAAIRTEFDNEPGSPDENSPQS